MIYGIGTDIVKQQRIQKNIDRWGDAFAQRILHPLEFQEYKLTLQRASFLAKRFAAKEAAAKALGTGFSNGVKLADVRVTHEHSGKPLLEFYGQALILVESIQIIASHISISDEREYVIAFVVLETKN